MGQKQADEEKVWVRQLECFIIIITGKSGPAVANEVNEGRERMLIVADLWWRLLGGCL